MPTIPPPLGKLRIVIIADPGAPGDMGLVYEQRVRHRLYGATFVLTTDANVANRYVSWQIYSVGASTPTAICTLAQTAGTARQYHWAVGHPALATNVGNHIYTPMPDDMWAEGLLFFQTTTENIQAGDTFTNIGLLVEEWIEP